MGSPHLALRNEMIPTLVCIILLTDLSCGIPAKSPIQISTQAILRKPQDFKSTIEGHRMSERVERSATSVAGRGGRGRQEICEVEESHILLTSDLPVAACVSRITSASHSLVSVFRSPRAVAFRQSTRYE